MNMICNGRFMARMHKIYVSKHKLIKSERINSMNISVRALSVDNVSHTLLDGITPSQLIMGGNRNEI